MAEPLLAAQARATSRAGTLAIIALVAFVAVVPLLKKNRPQK
jgi:hypothetical protein